MGGILGTSIKPPSKDQAFNPKAFATPVVPSLGIPADTPDSVPIVLPMRRVYKHYDRLLGNGFQTMFGNKPEVQGWGDEADPSRMADEELIQLFAVPHTKGYSQQLMSSAIFNQAEADRRARLERRRQEERLRHADQEEGGEPVKGPVIDMDGLSAARGRAVASSLKGRKVRPQRMQWGKPMADALDTFSGEENAMEVTGSAHIGAGDEEDESQGGDGNSDPKSNEPALEFEIAPDTNVLEQAEKVRALMSSQQIEPFDMGGSVTPSENIAEWMERLTATPTARMTRSSQLSSQSSRAPTQVDVPNIQAHTLFEILRNGDINAIAKILADNGDLLQCRDEEGFTLLETAIVTHNHAGLNTLLMYGANIEEVGITGTSPIHLAVAVDNEYAVQELLLRGANPNVVSEGMSLLHTAAVKGRRLALVLLEKGAKVDIVDKHGFTPLHYAAAFGRLEAVEILLKNGADLMTLSRSGDYPYDIAVQNGHEHLKPLLQVAQDDVTRLRHIIMSNKPVVHAAIERCTEEQLRQILDNATPGQIVTGLSRLNENDEAPLHLSARLGKSGHLQVLLDHDAPIEQKGAQGSRPIHYAARGGHSNIISSLVSAGAEVEAENNSKLTALHMACAAAHTSAVHTLVESGARIDAVDHNGWTPLHYAAVIGNLDCARILLENGADPNVIDQEHQTPLDVATENDHVRLAWFISKWQQSDADSARQELLRALAQDNLHNAILNDNIVLLHSTLNQSGEGLNQADSNDHTPLAVAARLGKLQFVKALLAAKANVNHKNALGMTALHYAASNGRANVLSALIQAGADVEVKTKAGATALSLACVNAHPECTNILILAQAKVDVPDIKGDCPLHCVAKSGTSGCAIALLSAGADINAENKNGEKPIDVAEKTGNFAIAKLLTSWEPETATTIGQYGDPAKVDSLDLHMAVRKRDVIAVLMMLRRNVNVLKRDNNNQTALHIAARLGLTDIAVFLLQSGAKVDAAAKQDITPLHVASASGHPGVVAVLLEYGADPNIVAQKGLRPIHLSTGNGHHLITTQLLHAKADPSVQDHRGFSPLHYAAEFGTAESVKSLLEVGAKTDTLNIHLKSPLDTAIDAFQSECAKIIRDHMMSHKRGRGRKGLSTSSRGEDLQSSTPVVSALAVHEAAHAGDLELLRKLLSQGQDPNHTNEQGFTPLHIVARTGRFREARELLQYGAALETPAGPMNLTPLHLAAAGGHAGVIQEFMDHAADVARPTRTMSTALHFAAGCGSPAATRILLKNNADPNVVNSRGYTPLHLACEYGSKECVNLLLHSGARMDSANENGLTPYQLAVEHQHTSVAQFLRERLQRRAEPIQDIVIQTHASPLHSLVAKNNQALLRSMLVRNEAPVGERDVRKNTVIHIAAIEGNTEILTLLLKFGADINAGGQEGLSALHLAVLHNRAHVIHCLGRAGAEIDIPDPEGRTPLFYAAREGNIACTRALVYRGADPKRQNEDGVTPQQIARELIHQEIYDLLSRVGSNTRGEGTRIVRRLEREGRAKGRHAETVASKAKKEPKLSKYASSGNLPAARAAAKRVREHKANKGRLSRADTADTIKLHSDAQSDLSTLTDSLSTKKLAVPRSLSKPTGIEAHASSGSAPVQLNRSSTVAKLEGNKKLGRRESTSLTWISEETGSLDTAERKSDSSGLDGQAELLAHIQEVMLADLEKDLENQEQVEVPPEEKAPREPTEREKRREGAPVGRSGRIRRRRQFYDRKRERKKRARKLTLMETDLAQLEDNEFKDLLTAISDALQPEQEVKRKKRRRQHQMYHRSRLESQVRLGITTEKYQAQLDAATALDAEEKARRKARIKRRRERRKSKAGDSVPTSSRGARSGKRERGVDHVPGSPVDSLVSDDYSSSSSEKDPILREVLPLPPLAIQLANTPLLQLEILKTDDAFTRTRKMRLIQIRKRVLAAPVERRRQRANSNSASSYSYYSSLSEAESEDQGPDFSSHLTHQRSNISLSSFSGSRRIRRRRKARSSLVHNEVKDADGGEGWAPEEALPPIEEGTPSEVDEASSGLDSALYSSAGSSSSYSYYTDSEDEDHTLIDEMQRAPNVEYMNSINRPLTQGGKRSATIANFQSDRLAYLLRSVQGGFIRGSNKLKDETETAGDDDADPAKSVNLAWEACHRRVLHLLMSGSLRAVFRTLNEFLSFYPNCIEARRTRANFYYHHGMSDEALRDYNELIRMDPTDHMTYFRRAVMFEMKAKYVLAMSDYNDSIRAKPTAEALLRRAKCHIMEGHDDLALEDYSQARLVDPDCLEAYSMRGLLHAKLGNFDEAREDFGRVIRLDPADAKAYHLRGNLERNTDPHLALQDLSISLLLDPVNHMARHSRGVLYHALGDDEAALHDYHAAIEIRPDHVASYVNAALIYMENPVTLPMAIKYCLNAITLNPHTPRPFFCLAEAYRRAGRRDMALKTYGRLIVMNPSDPRAYEFRARCLMEMKRQETAVHDLIWFVTLSPANKHTKTRLAQLYAHRGEHHKAKRLFLMSIREYPIPETYYQLGISQQLCGNWPAAEAAFAQAAKLVESTADQVKYLMEKAYCAQKMGGFDSAVSQYTAIIKMDHSARAYHQRAVCRTMLPGKKPQQQALSDFDKAIQIDPSLYDALLDRASLHQVNGRVNLALADYHRVSQLDPQSLVLYINRGVLLASLKEYKAAINDFLKVVRIDPRSLLGFYNLGVVSLTLGRLQHALQYLSTLILMNDGVASAWATRGYTYLQIGDMEAAVGDYARAVELAPQNVSTHVAYGYCLYQLGRWRDARDVFCVATSVDPHHVAAHIATGNCCMELAADTKHRAECRRYLTEAAKAYSRAIHINPSHASAHANLGQAMQRLGKPMESWQHFTASLNIAPQNVSALEGRGRLAVQTHNLLGAYVDLTRAIPGSTAREQAEILVNRGVVNEMMNHTKTAVEDLKRAIRMDKDCMPAHFNLGNLHLKSGMWKLADKHYSNGLKIEPDDSALLINRGIARIHMEDYQGALQDLDKAISLKPTVLAARVNRGYLLTLMNRLDDADEDMKAVASLLQQRKRKITSREVTQLARHYAVLGNLKRSQNDNESALANFAAALALDDNTDLGETQDLNVPVVRERVKFGDDDKILSV
eukprot:TRINITY_DN2960_c0_g2_i3.p1 TRINITY_DN2960_c0_g2~~TRINITY_DN2960_c0_g2_i3.p1  ORF type:complete len:3332 (+),score=486.18 TRINITY_DN2960_c0_g2_i3:638-9997(+)